MHIHWRVARSGPPLTGWAAASGTLSSEAWLLYSSSSFGSFHTSWQLHGCFAKSMTVPATRCCHEGTTGIISSHFKASCCALLVPISFIPALLGDVLKFRGATGL